MSLLARRDFLQISATAVIGFPFLDHLTQAAEPLPKADLLALARERMKQEIKPGLVVIVPVKYEDAAKLAHQLSQLLGGHHAGCALWPTQGSDGSIVLLGQGDFSAQLLFCQTVVVCLPIEQAKKAFPDLPGDAGVLLLDLEGKAVASLPAHPELFGKEFTARVTELVHGKNGERLAAMVQAQRQALGEAPAAQFDRALKDLESDNFATRQAATDQLEKLAARSTALLASAYRTRPPLDLARRLDQLFSIVYKAAPADQASARLPFGVAWNQRSTGCADNAFAKCGLSSAAPPTRLFLRFLTETQK
jgi:hypothetical protein